jgi:hypothetical protein
MDFISKDNLVLHAQQAALFALQHQTVLLVVLKTS